MTPRRRVVAPPGPSRRRSVVARALAWLVGALALGIGAAGWLALHTLGRTPAELLDQADRRVATQPVLRALAAPLLAGLRWGFDAPPPAVRALGFVVPPPPPRRGPDAVRSDGSAVSERKVWRVGPERAIQRIAEAAARARDGDVVEIDAGDYRGDVAVWTQRRLTIRGVGGAARLYADGQSAEGKAIWVIQHGDFDISNIDFVGARVADGNGAGIRFEGGRLRLRDCLFWDNQMGLLTVGSDKDAQARVEIESSEFAYSHVQGRWGHNLYVGTIDHLSVTGSYFHHAGAGHLLKSRARVNDIRYNRFTDEIGGRASYELDFPNGGEVRLVGNLVEQQRGTENGRLIAYGEEGYIWPYNQLQLTSNTLVNALPWGGSFVHVAAGAAEVVSANNLRVGGGRDQWHGVRLTQTNDHRAKDGDFRAAAQYDYRWRDAAAAWRYQALTGAQAAQLTPQARYVHPRRVEPLGEVPVLAGAQPVP
jgi:hypothetical protein